MEEKNIRGEGNRENLEIDLEEKHNLSPSVYLILTLHTKKNDVLCLFLLM